MRCYMMAWDCMDGMGCYGLVQYGMDVIVWDGIRLYGNGWQGMGWSGMIWDGVRWDGTGLYGMVWDVM